MAYVKTSASPVKNLAYSCGGGSYGKHVSALKPVVNHDMPLKKGKKGK